MDHGINIGAHGRPMDAGGQWMNAEYQRRMPVVHGFRRVDALAYNLVRFSNPNTVYADVAGPVEQDETTGEKTRLLIQFPPMRLENIFFIYVALADYEVYGITAGTGGMIVNLDRITAEYDPATLTWNNQPARSSVREHVLEFTSADMLGDVPYQEANFEHGFGMALGAAGLSTAVFYGLSLRVDNASLATGERRRINSASGAFVYSSL